MNLEELFDAAEVELTAVISTARLSSGELARFAAGEAIEIAAAGDQLPEVIFVIGGRRLARAVWRNENGTLTATIIELCGAGEEDDWDEWSLVPASSA